jgi:hypothetical protein
MKQCLFLETQGVYRKLLRINRTKNLITGSFFNSVVRAAPDLKDFHFTYPPRGNYHVTIVALDGTEYRVYATSATRRSVNDKQSDLIDKESLPFFWKMFVPPERTRPSFEDFQQDPTRWDTIFGIGLPCVQLAGPSEIPAKNDLVFSYKVDPERMVTLNVTISGSDYVFKTENPNFPKPLFENRDGESPQIVIHFF